MKKIAILSIIALAACTKPGVSTHETTNSQIKVELLFEVDDCKVYRFDDGGMSNRYFCNCNGSVEWTERHGSGKHHHYVNMQIPTSVNPK